MLLLDWIIMLLCVQCFAYGYGADGVDFCFLQPWLKILRTVITSNAVCVCVCVCVCVNCEAQKHHLNSILPQTEDLKPSIE